MGAKNQAFAIFPTALISHYPLPLTEIQMKKIAINLHTKIVMVD
jgi:hypothetical protein